MTAPASPPEPVLRPYALSRRLGGSVAAAGAIGAIGAIGWSVARHEPGNLFTPQPVDTMWWALGTAAVALVTSVLTGALTFPRMARAVPAPSDSVIEAPHRSNVWRSVAILTLAGAPALIGGILDEGHQVLATVGGGGAGGGVGLALVAQRVSSWERARKVKLLGAVGADRIPQWYTVSASAYDAGMRLRDSTGQQVKVGALGFAQAPPIDVGAFELEGQSLRGRTVAYAIGGLLSATGLFGAVAALFNPSWLPFGPPDAGKCVARVGLDLEVRACWDGADYVITKRAASRAQCGELAFVSNDAVWCMRERE